MNTIGSINRNRRITFTIVIITIQQGYSAREGGIAIFDSARVCRAVYLSCVVTAFFVSVCTLTCVGV